MGIGPFNFDRPLTAGDEGWLGAPRPLVGAANAIEADVSTQSAAQVAIANSTPESIQNIRDELNHVNRELDNKRDKQQRLEEIQEDVLMGFVDMTYDTFERRRETLFDDITRLENMRDDLRNQLNDVKQRTQEGDLPPDEIEDGIMEPVANALNGVGVSKGPFVEVGPETTTIIFSKTNIRQEHLSQTEDALLELGFQVGDVRGVEL